MNYYEPKQRVGDGRWDYTRNNRATGYCCEAKLFTEEDAWLDEVMREQENKEIERFRHKYHSDGHATEKEACECYKEYVLDRKLRFSQTSNQQHKCMVCGEWTQNYVEVDCSGIFMLCDQHNNREEISKLYGAPSWGMASW